MGRHKSEVMRKSMPHLLRSIVLGLSAICILTACETFNLETPSAEIINDGTRDLVDNSDVIAVVNSVDSADLLERKAARRGYSLQRRETLPGLGFVMLTFKAPIGLSTNVASRELEKLEPHATAGQNHRYTLQAVKSRDLTHGRLYADKLISWPAKGCRASLAIGMIDGGIDLSATDLSDSNIVIKNFTKTATSAGAIEHGTAIAELLIGKGRLIDTTLHSAVVVSDDPDAQSSSGVEELLRALDWMQSSGVKIVNISLAGPYNKTLDRAIQRASKRGMILVAAVGNDGANANPRYPAAFENVIAATAIDSHLKIYDNAVHGTHVDFAAPGVEVFIETQNRYISGTSVATPFITARIASDLDIKADANLEKVRNLLKQNVLDLGVSGQDSVYGHGLIKSETHCQH